MLRARELVGVNWCLRFFQCNNYSTGEIEGLSQMTTPVERMSFACYSIHGEGEETGGMARGNRSPAATRRSHITAMSRGCDEENTIKTNTKIPNLLKYRVGDSRATF